MDFHIHGRPENINLIEWPRVEENIIRNDLFVRERDTFVQVTLRDRNVENNEGNDREMLQRSLPFLQDLKFVFQVLGPLAFSLRSTTNAPRRGLRRGNPACLTTDGTRQGQIEFGLVSALVEQQGNYEQHARQIEEEMEEQQNINFQQFLIFNYGERIKLVSPNTSGQVPRLRKRGLSMKEIELILFVVEFLPGMRTELPSVMPYIAALHWDDIFNFVDEYRNEYQHVMEHIRPYLTRFVTNTFLTAFQNLYDFDLSRMPEIELDEDTIIQNDNDNN